MGKIIKSPYYEIQVSFCLNSGRVFQSSIRFSSVATRSDIERCCTRYLNYPAIPRPLLIAFLYGDKPFCCPRVMKADRTAARHAAPRRATVQRALTAEFILHSFYLNLARLQSLRSVITVLMPSSRPRPGVPAPWIPRATAPGDSHIEISSSQPIKRAATRAFDNLLLIAQQPAGR